MKKTELLILFAIIIATTAFIDKKDALIKPGFTITGLVKGYADSTKLYLEDESGAGRKMIDSAIILNGQFKFSGSINGKVIYALVRTKNFSDYTFFWLENSAIRFVAEKGKFHYAAITGSKTQDDNERLAMLTNPVNKKMDSLNTLPKKSLSEQAKSAIYKQLDSLRKLSLDIDVDFIRHNPGSLVSASVLDVYSSTIGKQVTTELYNNFSQENKDSQYGNNILQFITLNKDIKIGDHYVDFSQKTPDGTAIKISDYTGKLILIDFWASWCVPCRRENPELVKTYAEFKDKGFEIVSVSLDAAADKKDWVAAIEKDGLKWPNISALTGDKCDAALIYGISGIPDNFLIDKNGIIIARNLRGQALRDKLKEILN